MENKKDNKKTIEEASIEEIKKAENTSSKDTVKAELELAIMKKHKTDVLFQNKKGEYFTSENLARLSEKDPKDVKKITKEIVESKLK